MDYKGDDTLAPGTDEITYRCELRRIEYQLHVSSEETGGERAREYRIYAIGAGGQISGVRIFACAEDTQAIQKAQQAVESHHVVELWKRHRLIKQFVAKPED
jgi:hypothetical protein